MVFKGRHSKSHIYVMKRRNNGENQLKYLEIHEHFGHYINAIHPSELELKDTTLTSNEVCYLDTRIKTGDSNTPFHLSVYDKRDDFSFRIVNFPYIDSNIPANPAYGVYISQLVRYARICT